VKVELRGAQSYLYLLVYRAARRPVAPSGQQQRCVNVGVGVGSTACSGSKPAEAAASSSSTCSGTCIAPAPAPAPAAGSLTAAVAPTVAATPAAAATVCIGWEDGLHSARCSECESASPSASGALAATSDAGISEARRVPFLRSA
jgi:hypothetical protein